MNQHLKIEISDCCDCKEHKFGYRDYHVHWVILAYGDVGWYNTGSCGIEACLEQAGSKAFQEYKVLKERINGNSRAEMHEVRTPIDAE